MNGAARPDDRGQFRPARAGLNRNQGIAGDLRIGVFAVGQQQLQAIEFVVTVGIGQHDSAEFEHLRLRHRHEATRSRCGIPLAYHIDRSLDGTAFVAIAQIQAPPRRVVTDGQPRLTDADFDERNQERQPRID